jgi:hypothetical protein
VPYDQCRARGAVVPVDKIDKMEFIGRTKEVLKTSNKIFIRNNI